MLGGKLIAAKTQIGQGLRCGPLLSLHSFKFLHSFNILVWRQQMNYSVREPMVRTGSALGVLNSSSAPSETHKSARGPAGYSRETVLLSCVVFLLLLLVVTALAARLYHKQEHVLADQWFERGEGAFRAGNALKAARYYRNALVYSESNTVFQFHLAQALTAAHTKETDEEAESYLLSLLAESPGSGEINLELAHIAARQSSKTPAQDTLRYYYGAIYGVWQSDPLPKRWDARSELCDYLLAHGMTAQAQPETIALAQDVPLSDWGRQREAAALLGRAGLWDRALTEYRAILSSHRRDQGALAGAGLAAFQVGQYAAAVEYLAALPRTTRLQPEVSTAFAESREVEAISPFLDRLSSRERARRTVEALTRARVLMQNCSQGKAAPPSPQSGKSKLSGTVSGAQNGATANSALQQLQATLAQKSRVWKELNFVRDPSQIVDAMNWVFQVEKAAGQTCGPSQSLLDRALLLVAKSQTGFEA